MKYIKLFENYFSSEEVETESIDDLKMKLIDLLNEKLRKQHRHLCTAESDPENENLFTINGEERELECEIKPYDSKGREGYPNYVIYLKTDKISKGAQGPWGFSEDRLHYVVDIIFNFLIGLYDK